MRQKIKEPASDIKKLINDDIIKFYRKNQEVIHPSILLQAIILQVSEEDLNLERMEFIGDAFLQYLATAECYFEHPHENKTQLTSRRTDIVKNSFLFKMAEDKKKSVRTFMLSHLSNTSGVRLAITSQKETSQG